MGEHFPSKAICYRYFFKATSVTQSFFNWKRLINDKRRSNFCLISIFPFFTRTPSKANTNFICSVPCRMATEPFFVESAGFLSHSQFMTFNPIAPAHKLAEHSALAITLNLHLSRPKAKDERRRELKTGFWMCLLQFLTSLMCFHHLCIQVNVLEWFELATIIISWSISLTMPS